MEQWWKYYLDVVLMWTARYSQILYRVGYDQDEEFKKLKAIQSLRQNDTSKSSGYTLPKAFFQRCPISKAKLEDLLQLREDLTIPSSLHQFHNELKSRNQEEVDDHPSESEEEEEWHYYYIILRKYIVRNCY